jgi:hypothetical protein
MKQLGLILILGVVAIGVTGCRGGAEEPSEPLNVVTATEPEQAQPTGPNDRFKRYAAPN